MDLDATRLQVLEVHVGLREFLLSGTQVLRGFLFFELSLVLLELELELGLVLQLLRGRGRRHELRVLGGRGALGRLGLGLQPQKICLDNLEHTDDAALAALHALVGGHLGHLLLLQERGLAGIKLLEHNNSLLHSLRARLGVRDSVQVISLLLLAQLGRLGHRLGEIGLLLRQLSDGGGHLNDAGGEALDGGGKLLDLGGLLVALELVRLQLLVAPSLVVSLSGGLLLELVEKGLDHVDDLGEGGGLGRDGSSQRHQALGAQSLGTAAQQGHGLVPGGTHAGARLQKRHALLDLQEVDVLFVAAGDLGRGDDLEGVRDGHQLVGTDHLVLLVRGLLDGKGGLDLLFQRLVVGLSCLGLRQLALGLRGGGELLRLGLGLLITIGGVLLDRVGEVQLHKIELVSLVQLGRLHVRKLTRELIQQAVQQLHDATRLELVRGHLRSSGLRGLLLLLQRSQDRLHAGHRGRHALQEDHCLSTVVILCGHDLDGALERINGLRVVLVQSIIVGLLDLTDRRRCLLVACPDGDVLVVLRDLLGQLRGSGSVFLDVRHQHINLLVGLLD
mmetsp:Transcript_9556/g.25441  ORF Transcript_9556/g.25441 Transcript_9556/m.25441 type:complete len:560 (+) Transcript_9556:242-1921(+)